VGSASRLRTTPPAVERVAFLALGIGAVMVYNYDIR
jgi:hypothetical protein